MKNLNMVLAILIATSITTFANAGHITGKVITDAHQTGLKGVNIVIKNPSTGTTTNAQGEFEIKNMPSGKILLVVSHIGFQTKQISVNIEENKTVELTIFLKQTTVPLNKVVVTSTKYEKQVKDLALPLGIIQSEKIAQRMPTTISDILSTESGISLARDGIWGTHVTIRGMSRNNIVTLVDGNRIDTSTDMAAGLSMVAVNDIQRVEVVKGAASSLYGTGAVGGVVNIITKDGWYNDKTYAKSTLIGGYNSVNESTDGHLIANIGSKHWYVKLSGMLRDADNTKTPDGTLNNSQYKDDNISLKSGIKLIENHELLLNYQRYSATDVGIPGGNTLFPSVADVRYPEEKRELKSATYAISNLSNYLSKLSLKYFEQDILRDVENIPHTVKNIPATDTQPAKVMNVLKVLPSATHDTQGFQFQTDWVLGQNDLLVAGIDAWEKRYEGKRTKQTRIDVLSPVDNSVMQSINKTIGELPLPNSTYQSMGFFIQNELALYDKKLYLTTGGRFDKITVDNEQVLNPLYDITNGVQNNTPANQVVLWDATNADDQSWSGNIGLLYHTVKNFDITMNVSRSFRSPYLGERYQYIDLGNLVKIGDPNLLPEKSLSGDIGFRLWAPSVSFMGNIYINNLNDLVIETPATFEGRNAMKKSNVGKARLYGFDLQADVPINEYFSLFANAAYVKGQDTLTDKPLPLIPPFNGRFGLHGMLNHYFTFDLSLTSFLEQDRIADWEMETPGYNLIDLYVNLLPFKLFNFNNRVLLGIENLSNKAYRNHLSTNRGLVTAEPGRNFLIKWQLEVG